MMMMMTLFPPVSREESITIYRHISSIIPLSPRDKLLETLEAEIHLVIAVGNSESPPMMTKYYYSLRVANSPPILVFLELISNVLDHLLIIGIHMSNDVLMI
jgi:hypothetical protein